MTQGILPQWSIDVFTVLRTCHSCARYFAMQPVKGKDEGSKHQVYRCKFCGKETMRPEPRDLRRL